MEGNLYDWIRAGGFSCTCGKYHRAALEELVLRQGALEELPNLMQKRGYRKAFLLTDPNAYWAAGDRVCQILQAAGMDYTLCVYAQEHPAPNEQSVGTAVMHFDESCDLVLAVGSGVVNDNGKILANFAGRGYFIVATAPSMDGYASATSSMERDGLKVSLNSKCPEVIIADLDILCHAPAQTLCSGLGDMVAKYISICEWRIANLLVGEEYCPEIAQMVRGAVEKCMKNLEGLVRREPDAVAAVMEGLVVTGIAMSYAGLSRPASGMEHYFSHIWDMRTLAFGTPGSTHGIQCGIGTLLSIRVYEYIQKLLPDAQQAQKYVASFQPECWNAELRQFLGQGAEAMIRAEAREQKYDLDKHTLRLQKIIASWPQILQIIREEIPACSQVEGALKAIGAPTIPQEIGLTADDVRTTFYMTKDIRDKYIGSRLLWDLGVLQEAGETIF